MTRYVGLLRGVNVGGVTMKMADLAEVVRGLGYENVTTVLASGNVLFETPDAAAASTEKLESALRERFDYEAWVHVLPLATIQKIVDAFPFDRDAARHAYVVFVENPDVRAGLLGVTHNPSVEHVAAGSGVIYWSVQKGDTLGSAWGGAQSASKHKRWVTARNLNTLEKLLR